MHSLVYLGRLSLMEDDQELRFSLRAHSKHLVYHLAETAAGGTGYTSFWK